MNHSKGELVHSTSAGLQEEPLQSICQNSCMLQSCRHHGDQHFPQQQPQQAQQPPAAADGIAIMHIHEHMKSFAWLSQMHSMQHAFQVSWAARLVCMHASSLAHLWFLFCSGFWSKTCGTIYAACNMHDPLAWRNQLHHHHHHLPLSAFQKQQQQQQSTMGCSLLLHVQVSAANIMILTLPMLCQSWHVISSQEHTDARSITWASWLKSLCEQPSHECMHMPSDHAWVFHPSL